MSNGALGLLTCMITNMIALASLLLAGSATRAQTVDDLQEIDSGPITIGQTEILRVNVVNSADPDAPGDANTCSATVEIRDSHGNTLAMEEFDGIAAGKIFHFDYKTTKRAARSARRGVKEKHEQLRATVITDKCIPTFEVVTPSGRAKLFAYGVSAGLVGADLQVKPDYRTFDGFGIGLGKLLCDLCTEEGLIEPCTLNQSPGGATSTSTTRLSFITGVNPEPFVDFPVRALGGGEFSLHTDYPGGGIAQLPECCFNGQCEFRITADVFNEISELNEGNNEILGACICFHEE